MSYGVSTESVAPDPGAVDFWVNGVKITVLT
jgi:hypothetical protein